MKLPLVLATVSSLSLMAAPAEAYQIDCAILLCLAGGFPPSDVCLAAKATMIQRVTPFPIEPPLQLWNCPMNAAFIPQSAAKPKLWQLTYDFTQNAAGRLTNNLILAQEIAREELPEPIQSYVRSIEVFHVKIYSHREDKDGDCHETSVITKGTYDRTGEFSWRGINVEDLPTWMRPSTICQDDYVPMRGVGMQWADAEGQIDHEYVPY